MIVRAVIAALIIALLLVACTVQRVPTECAAPDPTTMRIKNRTLTHSSTITTLAARGDAC